MAGGCGGLEGGKLKMKMPVGKRRSLCSRGRPWRNMLYRWLNRQQHSNKRWVHDEQIVLWIEASSLCFLITTLQPSPSLFLSKHGMPRSTIRRCDGVRTAELIRQPLQPRLDYIFGTARESRVKVSKHQSPFLWNCFGQLVPVHVVAYEIRR